MSDMDKLLDFLFDGDFDDWYKAASSMVNKVESLEQQLKETQEKLKHYETGFKGACPTCENVGEVNLKLKEKLKKEFDTGYNLGVKEAKGEIDKLREKLKIAVSALENLIDNTEHGVKQWQAAWSPNKETKAQTSIRAARQALEKIKG